MTAARTRTAGATRRFRPDWDRIDPHGYRFAYAIIGLYALLAIVAAIAGWLYP